MSIINREELELLIAIAVTKSELPVPFAFEKDYYVTQIIHSLADVKNDYFSLVFTGGTSLAKAHRLVMRMSEDCDFRIQSSKAVDTLNSNQRRKAIKSFRQDIINTLDSAGFLVDEATLKARDSGNYMSAFIPYESAYPGNPELRPDVKVEFMVVNTKLEPSPKPVTSLIRQVLGDEIPHPEKSINTISVTETAVDKWVALTRRIANTLHRDIRRSDHDLVRHIYDLYYIAEAGYLNDTIHGMVAQVISEDAARYKNHNRAYHDNPIAEINLALEALQKNSIWRERWDRFTANMVLSKDKLSYDDAMNSLVTHSEPLLAYLSKTPIMDFSNISHHESPMDAEKKFWGQSVIARELTQLYEHENPHIKRLIKLHKLGIEQGYTSELIKGMNNAITQLASNKAIMRILEVNTPTLYTKTKAVQHALHTEQDISH